MQLKSIEKGGVFGVSVADNLFKEYLSPPILISSIVVSIGNLSDFGRASQSIPSGSRVEILRTTRAS
tara:strand:+ start:294 stop:494 length:201 start_codon:yes stop_codon:yes gene_type:complete